MTALVVDASVVAKLLFEEEGSGEAEAALAAPGVTLLAPDLLVCEVGSVIWKRARRGEISPAQAAELLERFLMSPVDLRSARDVAPEAMALAMTLDRSVYDCMYLALAIAADGVMVTADVRLFNVIAATPLARHIRRLGA